MRALSASKRPQEAGPFVTHITVGHLVRSLVSRPRRAEWRRRVGSMGAPAATSRVNRGGGATRVVRAGRVHRAAASATEEGVSIATTRAGGESSQLGADDSGAGITGRH